VAADVRAAIVTAVFAAALIGGCGGGSQDDRQAGSGSQSRAATLERQRRAAAVQARHDAAVDRQLRAMSRAARRGDSSGVAAAQRELDRLAHSDPAGPPRPSTARDSFQRVLDDFRFKHGPLYVQQVESFKGAHRIFVAVDRDAFCLLTPAARRQAAAAVYGPADRRLRRSGVDDFKFILVPLTARLARREQALAIGDRGRLRLTRRDRGCE